MSTNNFPAGRYLARLGLDQWPALNAAGLAELVCAQARAISFENLDTLSGTPVDVRLDSIIDKVLERGRGGYCFELNGLLGAALQAAGFTAQRRLARVSFRRPGPGPRTHLLWLVELDGETWLADAGFGGPGTFAPIRFVPDVVTEQAGARFRLVDEGACGLHLQRWIDGAWADVYLIDRGPVLDMDIDMGNHFTSTWPGSPFRNIFMCFTRSGDDILSLEGNTLVRRNGHYEPVERQTIRDAEHLHTVLTRQFKLDVPKSLALASWQRVQDQAQPR
ncbi:MAG: arylamine N-acetyltransferase [Azonexaceae bacterium]|nr:arylamine N-acetyltransferase [Azonexaceae bacterium]